MLSDFYGQQLAASMQAAALYRGILCGGQSGLQNNVNAGIKTTTDKVKEMEKDLKDYLPKI